MKVKNVKCRRCGACCIALSISSQIPGTDSGKVSGEPCVHLSERNMCRVYDDRPDVCKNWQPSDLCGNSLNEALENLYALEKATKPNI